MLQFEERILSQAWTINGHSYSYYQLLEQVEKGTFPNDINAFLKEWLSPELSISVQTSGSTGTPKQLFVEKQKMVNSAEMTCQYLNLKKGDKALLCLSANYIAGKMMLVRSWVAGLDLYFVTPSNRPLKELDLSFDLVAMVPSQLHDTLKEEKEMERLQRIKHLILGGSALSVKMEEYLANFPNNIYLSYGMTETLSHIALRKINGTDRTAFYQLLPNIKICLSDEETLMIDAPHLHHGVLVTNDRVQLLSQTHFLVKGRKDNVINTGGIKLQIEELEMALQKNKPIAMAITTVPDEKWGEAIVWVIEENEFPSLKIDAIIKKLPTIEKPKYWYVIDTLPLTNTGKIDRVKLKKYALEKWQAKMC